MIPNCQIIYLEEDGMSILNSELDSLIMYYSCNVFILFKEGFLTMNRLNKAVWPGFSLKVHCILCVFAGE